MAIPPASTPQALKAQKYYLAKLPSKSLVFTRLLTGSRWLAHPCLHSFSTVGSLTNWHSPPPTLSRHRRGSLVPLYSLVSPTRPASTKLPQHHTVAGYGRQSGATRPVHPSLSLVYPPPNILLPAFSLDAAQAYLARLHLSVLFKFARLSPRKRLEDSFSRVRVLSAPPRP